MPTGTEGDLAATREPATPADHTLPTIPLLPEVTEERPRGLRLTARVTLGTGALLAATIGLALAVATWRADALTRRKIRDDLRSAPAVYASYDAAEAAGRTSQVRSLAEQPGTKALLAELGANAETFHDSARDFAANLGASAVLLFDARGLLISRSDREPEEERGRDFSGVAWVAEPLRGREVSAYILEVTRNRRLLLVAAAPVTQGEGRERKLNGVLAGAFAVDDSRAARLGELLSGEAAFVANVAPRDAPPQVAVLAATPRLKSAPFHQVLAGIGGVDSLFARGDGFGPFEFAAAGDAYVGTAIPIKSGRGEPIAAFVVARSKDAELALFRQLRQALLLVGALTLLASLPVSYVLARRVSRPIEQLAEGAEAIRGGHLDIALPSEQAGEVGVLARAFGAMVLELKQKAALEALVAEMQRRPGDITLATTLRPAEGQGTAPAGPPASGSGGPEVGRLYAGRYVVLSVLGRGGMGTVFRVRDRELEEEVALKVLDTAVFGEGTRAGDLLKQEIRLARSITHPNVVRAHDLGDSGGVRFLTMEYVAGTTLRELLDRHGRLDLGPGLQIAKQMCRGLAAVHKAGVIHGDLKPRNVMVMANGVLKLMDFGVARGVGGGPGLAAASPHYMSPEQARGGELDERTDLYSAGVVLYEIFTGRRPFEAERPQDLAPLHMFEEPVAPRTLRPDLPSLLEQVILTCLAKSRLQRPATASDLERALMRVHV